MGKNKLARFEENTAFPCLIQPKSNEVLNADHSLKGKWKQEFFRNENPLILELGCGKGEYAIGLSRIFPNKNFIGMDIKGARLWRGARTVNEEKLPNVGFIRSKIDFTGSFFAEGEVDEIWLTFSDPQPKKERKRLTSPIFIERYKKFLKKDGIINVKTDSDLLYGYTLDQIKEHDHHLLTSNNDIYNGFIERQSEELKKILSIRTHYESIWLKNGIKIKYISFQL
jgi:tRNA (guanine-N7-)-methyltransferase